MEKSDDCTFELRTLLCPDSDWREALPKNKLTNIRSDEEGDAASQPVTLLEQLIEKQHDYTSHRQLHHNQKGGYRAKLADWAIHTR